MKKVSFIDSRIGKYILKFMGAVMESRFRYRFFPPTRILEGAKILPNQTVLELGCGTGFFTTKIPDLIGDKGQLISMDILPMSVEAVTKKVQIANFKNVRVVQGSALDTKLDNKSIDTILLFGVIPAPMLSLDKLLPEMHRILKSGGIMSVWPSSWMLKPIVRSGLFEFVGKKNGVLSFKKI